MQNIEIADLAEIGTRLHVARERLGLTAESVTEQVFKKKNASKLTRWESAEREGGCREVAMVGAFLGLDPNELLLRDPTVNRKEELSEHGKSELTRLFMGLRQMATLMDDPETPITEMANFVEALLKKWTIPPYTSIEAGKHPGTKAYVPLASDVARKIKGLAGEAPADYGEKTKRKRRKA